MIKLITPFKKLSSREQLISTVAIIVILLTLWSLSGSAYIPTPLEIIRALPRLIEGKDLIYNFQKSLGFCFLAIGYSFVIAYIFAIMTVLPIFKTFCQLLRKFRFLPSTGLSFLFMKMTGNIDQQMLWMMIFGVTTWLIDSFIGVALSVTDDDIMYARSLRLSRWQCVKEILIVGKASQILECLIANFAMAWMLLAAIENIAKASGGIGVILAESNKYYKFDEVYAIQIIILLTGIVIDYLLNKLKGFLFPYIFLKN